MAEMTKEERRSKRWAELDDSGVFDDDGSFEFRREDKASRELAVSIGELCEFDVGFCEMAIAQADALLGQLTIAQPMVTRMRFEWEGSDAVEAVVKVDISFSDSESLVLDLREQGYEFAIFEWLGDLENQPNLTAWERLDVPDVQRWIEYSAKRRAFIRDMRERPERTLIPYPAPPNPHPEKPER